MESNPQLNIIHVGIAFDQNYLNPFFALLTSIFENNKTSTIHIHCIATGISETVKERISTYVKANYGFIDYYALDSNRIRNFIVNQHWTLAVYYRLFFPFLIPDYIQRLLYIDTDTLVVGELVTFYNSNMNNYPVSAVYDNYVKKQPLIGIIEEGQYFNSGVLLIDIHLWKKQKISESAFQYLEDYPESIIYVDQCALNAVLKKNWNRIHPMHNRLTSDIPIFLNKKEKRLFIKEQVILHFTLNRPWTYLSTHPYRSLYKYYFEKSTQTKYSKRINDFSYTKILKRLKLDLIEWYIQHKTIFIPIKGIYRIVNKVKSQFIIQK